MTATTYFTSANHAARHARGAPRIAGSAVAFTPHRHNQDEMAREFAGPGVHALRPNGWSRPSQPFLPLSRYLKMTGFTEASNA